MTRQTWTGTIDDIKESRDRALARGLMVTPVAYQPNGADGWRVEVELSRPEQQQVAWPGYYSPAAPYPPPAWAAAPPAPGLATRAWRAVWHRIRVWVWITVGTLAVIGAVVAGRAGWQAWLWLRVNWVGLVTGTVGGLAVLLGIWITLGALGRCPGIHCPGCKCG